MPSFFFDVYDDRQISCDAFGDDFGSVEEARDQAAALLPALAADAIPGSASRNFAALVRDEDGSVVYRALLVYRGRKPDEDDHRWRVSVSNLQCEITRSVELRRYAREIGRGVQEKAYDVMALLEQARAAMDVSTKLMGRATGGEG